MDPDTSSRPRSAETAVSYDKQRNATRLRKNIEVHVGVPSEEGLPLCELLVSGGSAVTSEEMEPNVGVGNGPFGFDKPCATEDSCANPTEGGL